MPATHILDLPNELLWSVLLYLEGDTPLWRRKVEFPVLRHVHPKWAALIGPRALRRVFVPRPYLALENEASEAGRRLADLVAGERMALLRSAVRELWLCAKSQSCKDQALVLD